LLHTGPPTDYDLFLFHEGNLFRSYRVFGAHLDQLQGIRGVRFTLWAPRAANVSVVGTFNGWQGGLNPMERIRDSGVWTSFIPDAKEGDLYKYEIQTSRGDTFLKSDPFAFFSELRPGTASRVYSLGGYRWGDDRWEREKKSRNVYSEPLSIYEVHLGSWKRRDGGGFYTYRELAEELVDYVSRMGYTHLEILPLAEHPLDASWGYQATGYFSVTSRFGSPHDFMYFVDQCHQKNLGVILDWVPGHFCKDAHGLRQFDGFPLYEYEDSRRSESAEWGTLHFDLGRPEVNSFLVSNALFWMEVYHVDGLRVDAVADMLYLDYGKKGGDWVPNRHGGRENLEAISFLRKLNEQVFKWYPQALMIAEESSEWPQVSAPVYLGGLGFNFKWNMGWMNDILRYMQKKHIYRKWYHNLLTFSLWYAYSENFILPLSHDEVVHGKKSLLNKMPGDYWQKFADLRLLLGFMMAHPGKKLTFMGAEIGQFDEWREWDELGWNLLDYDLHSKMQQYVRALNFFYREEISFWEQDFSREGYEWIDVHNSAQSIISFLRKGREGGICLVLCNFTPVVYHGFKVGVPCSGKYRETFNSDLTVFGGSGQKNDAFLKTTGEGWHGRPFSLEITVPPLAMIVLEVQHGQK
jgi:1,4-alpha-glucan branching enzyme